MSVFILLLIFIMVGGDALFALAAYWLGKALPAFRWITRLVIGFSALMAIGLVWLIAGRFVGINSELQLPPLALAIIFVWHFIGLSVGLLAAVVYWTPVLSLKIFRRRVEAADSSIGVSAEARPSLSRRQFLAGIAVAAPVVTTSAASLAAGLTLNDFRVRRLDVPIRGLPSGIDGLTIAHVSDTHLGRFTDADTLRRIISATNDLDADLVLQTGDLINHDQRDLPVAAEVVRGVKSRHGQFIIEGNHDLIEGRDSFESFIRDAKLPILIDEIAGVRINGVNVELLGLSWLRRGEGASLDQAYIDRVRALAGRRSRGSFPILLAHHPHAFDGARAAGLPLTLSGHTHGGQLNLAPGLGFGRLMYRYWSGLYEREGNVAIVSNGAGNWFPLRVNAPAEILHLTLKRV